MERNHKELLESIYSYSFKGNISRNYHKFAPELALWPLNTHGLASQIEIKFTTHPNFIAEMRWDKGYQNHPIYAFLKLEVGHRKQNN